MKKQLLIGLLLLQSFSALPKAATITDADIEKQLQALALTSLRIHQKVGKLSKFFVEKQVKFVWGPLGEGKSGEYDADPLYSFKAFDCTTFVETIIALARSSDIEDFKEQMNEVRYKGPVVSYVTRNHFPSLDWIPNNSKILKDITPQIAIRAGIKLATAKAIISKKRWYAAKQLKDIQGFDHLSEDERILKRDALQKLGEDMLDVNQELEYIPFSAMFDKHNKFRPNQKLLALIPSGVIINTVSPSWDLGSTQMNISHQSIVVRVGNRLMLRHASYAKKYNRVVEVDFVEYYQALAKNPKSHQKGIHLMAIKGHLF